MAESASQNLVDNRHMAPGMRPVCPTCGAATAADGWCPSCHGSGALVLPPIAPNVPSTNRIVTDAQLKATTSDRAVPGRSRFRRSATTFGPVGRISWTLVLVTILLASIAVGAVWFACIYGLIAMPWALRDLWAVGGPVGQPPSQQGSHRPQFGP
jgi:hypothetical protein